MNVNIKTFAIQKYYIPRTVFLAMKRGSYFRTLGREIYAQRYFLIISLALLILSGILNGIAGNYVTNVDAVAVGDLILDILPPINMHFFFVYFWLAIISLSGFYALFFDTKRISLLIFHMGLLSLVRSAFITLTHLKTPIDAIPIHFPWPFSFLAFQNDLFFSGHTATPLVGFFVFRHSKIKYAFLALSLLMGFTVLAMHQHYSIDVFAAFFIVFGTYKFGELVLRNLRKYNFFRNWGI